MIATPLTALIVSMFETYIVEKSRGALSWAKDSLASYAGRLQDDLFIAGYKIILVNDRGHVIAPAPSLTPEDILTLTSFIRTAFRGYLAEHNSWFWNESSVDGDLEALAQRFQSDLITAGYGITR